MNSNFFSLFSVDKRQVCHPKASIWRIKRSINYADQKAVPIKASRGASITLKHPTIHQRSLFVVYLNLHHFDRNVQNNFNLQILPETISNFVDKYSFTPCLQVFRSRSKALNILLQRIFYVLYRENAPVLRKTTLFSSNLISPRRFIYTDIYKKKGT